MISMLLFVRPALDAVASTRISCTPRKRGWLAVLCAFLAVLLCVAGNVASAQTAAGNFGNINIGTTSPVISLVLTFATSDTLASTSVLTQGAVGLDFSDAGSDTCTANTAYTAGQTCTVNVTFTPRFAGTRLGAVILQDNSGNIIAIGRLQGTGVGPQVIFQPGIQSTLGSGLSSPEGVAVDGNGNIYFTEVNGSVLHEMLAVNGTLPASPVMRTIGSGLGSITFWALDGAGNLYVADYENNAVKEILAVNGSIPASPTIKTLGSGFSDPAGVAVDGNGNVFVTGLADNTVKEIVAVNGSVPASPVIRTLASSFHEPIGIAVDASGNVYVADLANNAVKEIEAVNGSIPVSPTIKTLGSGFNSPVGIAVDASGNVYVADLANNAVKEIEAVNGSIPASPTIITLGSGFDQPGGVVVDGSRNVFIADTLNNRLVKLDFADPPSLIFASTVVGSTSTDSPKTITIENAGNAALTFPIPSTGNNPTIAANFTLNSIGSSDCPLLNNESLEPATLAAGASCQLPISFAPTAAGTFSGSLALTDTNLNAAAPGYALQSILLSGTGVNNFTLGASPSALSVLQSGSVTTSITVTGVNGPAGSVNLAASGLPSGVTASFSPNPTTGTSVLTLTASSTAAAGTYNVSITGTSATLTATATLALTVNTPNFGISSSVGSAGMVPDSSLTSTITVTPKNGFTGSVSLVASGLPSGVTASFTPNPTTGTSILTLTASDTAASGDTILTITGTSGAQTATTHIEIGFPYFPPSFYLVPWNAYSTIPQGGIGTTTITVTDQNGFTGDVSLALSGLPSGVTASFGMNPTTGTSVLTLAVSDTAATGFHALTVTGASGTLSATANIYLTITPAAGFSPPSGSFGAINVGTSGPTQTLTYTFGANVILGSISVLTQGATGLDFANAGTGTCIANPVNTNTVGETCTVNVTFTPQFAGTRNGAVVLYDNNGNAIATAYLQGSGVGPQVNFFPGTQTTLGSGFDFASGVAVDGSGNLYVVDTIGNLGNVQEIMAVNGSIPANPTIKTLVGGLDCPGGPALDAAGNVYFFDVCYHTVNEIQAVNGGIPASPTVRTLTSQFASPAGITVDGSGNVYILDASNNTVNEILAVNGSIPTSPTITTLASGFKELNGIAVDGSGNVYVSDDISRQVFEIQAINGSIPAPPVITPLGSGFVIPRGIAVDVAGNVYVAEYFYNTVYEILAENGSIPASPTIQTLGTGLVYANGVAVDGNRNVFVADYGDGRVVKLDYADPPSLTFATTAVGSTSTDSPQTVTIENVGNAALSFPIPSTGNNPNIAANFTLNSNGATACPLVSAGSTTAGTLAAGASCQLPISFSPTEAGALSAALVLTDNNLNAAAPGYTMHSITLSGTSTRATPSITWPTPVPITYGTALSATQLNASSTVAGTFTYSPVAGTVLTAGAQTLTVTFTPTDTADYTTATATVTLTVTQATPIVAWPTPAAVTYGTPLGGTQLNANSTVGGSFTYSPIAGTVLAAGAQTLIATFTPTDTADYTTATATVTLTVNQATPSITWPTPAPITYGTALSATQLNASSTVAGTFTYSPVAGTVLTAGAQTLTVTFTPTDTADYTTATATVTLTVTQATPIVAWPTPAAVTYGTALSGTQLNANSTVAGSFIYSPAVGTILTAGQQTLAVTFAPTDTTDYTTATANVTLMVNTATPILTCSTPAPIVYGTPISAATFGCSPNVPGTFVYSPAVGTVLTAGPNTLSIIFTPTDTIDYTTAAATVTLIVNKAAPSITWATPVAITYGTALSGTQLNASSTVTGTFTYSPGAGTILNAGTQTLTATFTPTNSTDYANSTATVTLTVNKANPTISWTTPAAITFGTTLGATQLNASSPVAGTFTYSPAAGTVPAVGTDTLTVTFTPTDTTDYTTATGSVQLKVNPAPSFTLGASPASLTVAQGASGKSTITVTDQNGFAGSVTLAASGLPSGVTAAFATNPTTGTSVLTLTASATAAVGSATITIKGTSGSLTASTTVALTISCTPTTIVPYISINGGSTWTEESTAAVTSTSAAVDLGPQPASGGSWSWTGPNKYASTSRQINSIPLTVGTDSYLATYTSPSGCKSTETFTITVK